MKAANQFLAQNPHNYSSLLQVPNKSEVPAINKGRCKLTEDNQSKIDWMWEFWRRHKRKVYVTVGVLGSGYFLYKLYNAHRRKLSDLERELADQRRSEELIKSQVKSHFENIQRIADSTTLPHVMRCLSSQIEEELDLTHLTERLMKGKCD